MGACSDESNGTRKCGWKICDYLKPTEMRVALEAAGGVDALMYSAPCHMSSLEAAYELRDVTKLYVADEDSSGYIFWWDAIDDITSSLKADPDQDVLALGRFTIEVLRESNQANIEAGHFAQWVTRLPSIAATSTAALEDVAAAVDSLARSILDVLPQEEEAIRWARSHSHQPQSGELVDVWSFAAACQSVPALSELAEAVMATIDQAVIAQVASGMSPFGDAHGLSLYFPNPAGVYLPVEHSRDAYLGSGLSFLADTLWDELIEVLFGSTTEP